MLQVLAQGELEEAIMCWILCNTQVDNPITLIVSVEPKDGSANNYTSSFRIWRSSFKQFYNHGSCLRSCSDYDDLVFIDLN